jgi:glycosyltransferase involved in cell wall biosynthesis
MPQFSGLFCSGKRRVFMADGANSIGRRMRVLALGVNWFAEGSGGLDRVFQDLARSLPAQGIDLRGLVLGPEDAAYRSSGAVRAFGRQGAPFAERAWRARQAVSAALQSEAPDLVAVHFALFAAPALDLLGRRKLVVHFHGPWADEAAEDGAGAAGRALRRMVEAAIYRRATRVIALSRSFACIARDRYGVSPGRLRVVPGSVDLERFAPRLSRPAARVALGWPEGGTLLLAVRRLERRMGLDALIAAMPAIIAARPDAHLMIAGCGADAARLHALAAATLHGARIRFLGFLPDALLPLAYRAADLNIVPSRALEGFGLTAAEAIAAGTASVVTPVGGLPEVVEGLWRDLVMPAGDIGGGVLRALGGALPGEAACLAFARRRFCPVAAASGVAGVYREAVGG